jgi:hypothetical protein
VHFFRGKEYVLRMRLQLPDVKAAQLGDAAWVETAARALELSLASAVGVRRRDVFLANWTGAEAGGGATVDVIMADSQSHFNTHITDVPTSLSPVDQLAQLAETDMDALLEGLKFDSDASLQGMLPELARAYPVFVSTGDLPSLPPRSVALAAAAAGNDTVSFGATMTHSSVRWDELDTQLLGEVLSRRLAHLEGVKLSSVKLDWAASSSSQCAAAQSITLTITALRFPGCASRPLAVWANHMRVRPDQVILAE